MKKAVMYGGGNIGRGFIGALMSTSGYEVTFIDVAKPVVEELQQKHSYPLRYVTPDGFRDVRIEHVTAVNGNDTAAAAEAIASCQIMATAVGARILPYIVDNIVAGLRLRWERGGGPLDILICENLNNANLVVEGLLKERLTEEEKARFDTSVGLVEASIGRMVPVQTDEMKEGESLRVCVETYGFLPVDKDAFKGAIPDMPGLVPFSPFDYFLKRKLFLHNMGHATAAYLGGLAGLDYIYEAIDVPDIRLVTQNAMLESAQALCRHYGVALTDVEMHIQDLLHRFGNAALRDTCARVGGDPARKLSPDDRLVGSARLALEEGITPAYITLGIAAGIRRYLLENEKPCTCEEAAGVLKDVSKLPADSPITALALKYFARLDEPVSALRKAADAEKGASLHGII